MNIKQLRLLFSFIFVFLSKKLAFFIKYRYNVFAFMKTEAINALIAQLDRAFDYGSKG